jgi:predicted lipoprotein with Yx(FWY)xxD motif
MTRSRTLAFLTGAAVIPLIALAIAGCGGGGDTAAAAPAKTTGGQPATIGVATADLGKILVDSNDRTLYLFKDDPGTTSACSGACATAWPPLRANNTPTAGSGVNASLLATTKRSDGKPQVTYNGHPLYLFQGDEKPGDTEGQAVTAFGAAWYVLTPAGDQISTQPSSSNSGY